MAFFHNRTVNLVNLHYVIGSVALGGGGAFYSVYLLKSGMRVPVALLALAAVFGVRFAFRVVVLPIGIRLGVRRLLLIGTMLMAASFPFLIGVHGVGIGLLWLVLTSALADAFYWPSYHAYFAALGDAEHRGQQLGIREAVVAALGVVSPLAAGWFLVTWGPVWTFWLTGAVQALAAVPLLWTPDVAVPAKRSRAIRAAIAGSLMFVADGWIAASYFITWQIALFVALGESYLAYGGALAVAALVGAVSGLFLGKLIDSGKGTRAVWLATGVLALVTGFRALSLHSPALAVAANAMSAFVACIYVPTLMTAVYNNAKRSACVLRFHVVAEGGWDAGITLGLLSAAAITGAGLSVGYAVATAYLGIVLVFVLLRRYYVAHAAELVDATRTQPEEAMNI